MSENITANDEFLIVNRNSLHKSISNIYFSHKHFQMLTTWNYHDDIFFSYPYHIFSIIEHLTRGWSVSFRDMQENMQGDMLRYYSRNQYFLTMMGIWPYQPKVVKILLLCFLVACKISILATQVMPEHIICTNNCVNISS